MLKLNATTFIQTIKDDPEDRVQIEVGDSKQPDFKPQVKIMRWDNEVNFSLRAQEEVGAVLIELPDGTIVYRAKDYEVHQYDKPDASEEGGFEFEWVLKSKPATNVLTATIQTKGLSFFYQPPLTPEEIAEGASRPDNVEGSYAVYHSTKSNHKVDDKNYKCGKAFHIYRPKAIDANGVEQWCDLNIGGGLLTVTVPQKFLDDAVYPLRIDPTFGYTSIGASTDITAYTCRISYRFTMASENGTIDSITAYLNKYLANGDYRFGIFLWSDKTKVAESDNFTGDSTPFAWRTLNTNTNPSLSANTDYILTMGLDYNMGDAKYDTGTSNYMAKVTNAYPVFQVIPSFPNPNADTFNLSNKYSIYATYTASGGGAPATSANKHTLLMMGV